MTFHHVLLCYVVRGAWRLDLKLFVTFLGDIVSATSGRYAVDMLFTTPIMKAVPL